MKIEVLLSCMNQKDFSITEKMNLTTDILIVNQCDENKYEERIINGKKQRMIYTTQRGLSHSRNELLNNMMGDIGILCDDDVIYEKDYEKKIKKAYSEIKEADIIIFNTNTKRKNYEDTSKKMYQIKKLKETNKQRYFTSTRITFKKESIRKNNIWFNLNFGAGSIYSSGEEGLFLREARKKFLRVFEYPSTIASVFHESSTWFQGYNEKYFFNKGAWLKEAYPYTYFIFKWYFILKLGEKKLRRMYEINKWIKKGVSGYTKGLSYNEVEN